MSLINQVLSDLEKRGVNALPDEASIRVVPPLQKNRPRMVLLAVAMLALVLVAAEQWRRSRSQPGVSVPLAGGVQHGDGRPTGGNNFSRQAVSVLTASGALLAGEGMVQETVKPVAALQAESQPVAAVTQEISRVSSGPESREKSGNEASGSGMRLSFELNSIPMPSSLRAKSLAATATQRPVPAAASVADAAAGSKMLNPPGGRVTAELPVLPQRNTAHMAESKASVAVQAPAETPVGSVDKQIKQVSVQQQAENEFRRANGLMQQGYASDAFAAYEAALQLDAGHDAARLAMVGVLLENKRNADAERVLQDGLKHNPRHSGFAMLLARLQVERDALPLALDTLQKTLPYADLQADYQAFVAALLQRQNRHKEAITHYQIALQLSPGSGVWLMGLGISLQAVQRNEDARDAFRRAIEAHTLSAELQAFVKQRLKEL
ncbi:MAG: tetratricopeptide repeat protein [Gallionellaceae bacterium]|nr:tetratricopeptide repeat protein [Gallionellaceae bacterium]